MSSSADQETDETVRGYKAAENLYHSYLTGLILRTVLMRGERDAAEMMFRLFRAQQQATFMPGLEKLGLTHLPDAVACGHYHYLSNYLGDVNVEYMYESDRKVWVRYPPPRWIFDGAAICGIPSDVSRAMMLGWHSHNGVSLKNPRLGFVCTKQTVDGQPGLEGYFREYDHELSPEERLQFRPGEESPECEPAKNPTLDVADWPESRVQKALRNYAMEYVRNVLPVMISLFGPEEMGNIARTTARLIGMQYYDYTADLLGVSTRDAEGFGEFMLRIARGQGDEAEVERVGDIVVVRQHSWRIVRNRDDLSPALFESWNGLWEGALSVHNRRLRLRVAKRIDEGDEFFEWHIS